MINSEAASVKEIFSSIQGEGLYVGEKQLFIRFCGCNLNCNYCDTDFSAKGAVNYAIKNLMEKVKGFLPQTISLTGGEPLLHADFLSEFLNYANFKQKIYLETNGTLTNELKKVINKVDVIAMDIKLKSATGGENRFFENAEFLKIASDNVTEVFLKIIFDENIADDEIEQVCKIAQKHAAPIILQPKMLISPHLNIEEIFEKFYSKIHNIRLIPQTHKFLELK